MHIGSSVSGTVNAARLASQVSPVRVRIVDTGTASFAVSLCVWEAAEAVAAGATLEEAAGAAEAVGATVGNVFVVGALELARAGGRLGDVSPTATSIPVLTLAGGVMREIGRCDDIERAASAMAEFVRAGGTSLRAGVGIADRGTLPLVAAVEDQLRDAAGGGRAGALLGRPQRRRPHRTGHGGGDVRPDQAPAVGTVGQMLMDCRPPVDFPGAGWSRDEHTARCTGFDAGRVGRTRRAPASWSSMMTRTSGDWCRPT